MNETHLRAVFLMLEGRSVAAVSEEFKICRTSLYKLRRRATDAVRREIERPAKNKNYGHNRTPQKKGDKIVRLCQRHPTFSSYRISRKFQQTENEPVNPRTVQRIKKDIFCRVFLKDRLRLLRLIDLPPRRKKLFVNI